jgi:peptidoglycan-associated lipoprotein
MKTLALATLALVACHKDQAKPTLPAPVAAEPAAKQEPAKPQPPTPASPNISVSDDLAKQCTLRLDNTDQAPKFNYDGFELLPSDREVLDKVATCLTSGPLKGKKLQLVGRADPRGTEEYNLGLGSRRAHAVSEYLGRLGVTGRQLSETTRGALDARGTDDGSWLVDRRVDLELRQD